MRGNARRRRVIIQLNIAKVESCLPAFEAAMSMQLDRHSFIFRAEPHRLQHFRRAHHPAAFMGNSFGRDEAPVEWPAPRLRQLLRGPEHGQVPVEAVFTLALPVPSLPRNTVTGAAR